MRGWKNVRKGMVGLLLAMVAVLCCVSPAAAQGEHRGDLNLNGLPFELEDAAIFANYFVMGLPAFVIAPDSQIAATDINMDGIYLTVADYVMMIRIEMGAGDPPSVDPDTFAISVIYNYTDTSVIVAARFDAVPVTMFMEFDFAVEPTYAARLLYHAGAITMGTADAGKVVMLLVTGMNDVPVGSEYIPLVEMAYQTDKPTLIRAGAQGANGEFGVVAQDSTYTVGDVNDDGNINIGDAIYIVNWVFRGGPMPPHEVAADINCDQAHNIGDAVYIVNYIFRSGPVPCGFPSGSLVSHSSCLSMDKAGEDGGAKTAEECIEYQYGGQGTLLLTHANAGLNCCPENFPATVTVAGGVITIDETPIPGMCDCLCLFNLDYTIINVSPGTYQISVLGQCLSGEDEPLQGTIDLVSAPTGSICLQRNHYPW